MDRPLTVRPSHRLASAILSLFFVAATLAYAWIALFAFPHDRRLRIHVMGIFGAVCFGSMLYLSAYSWLFARRHRLTLYGDELIFRGVFNVIRIRLHMLDSIEWKRPSAVTLRAPGMRLAIYYGHYFPDDAARLAVLLHHHAPRQIQKGWTESAPRPRPSPVFFVTETRRYFWTSVITYLIMAALGECFLFVLHLQTPEYRPTTRELLSIPAGLTLYPAIMAAFWFATALDAREWRRRVSTSA